MAEPSFSTWFQDICNLHQVPLSIAKAAADMLATLPHSYFKGVFKFLSAIGCIRIAYKWCYDTANGKFLKFLNQTVPNPNGKHISWRNVEVNILKQLKWEIGKYFSKNYSPQNNMFAQHLPPRKINGQYNATKSTLASNTNRTSSMISTNRQKIVRPVKNNHRQLHDTTPSVRPLEPVDKFLKSQTPCKSDPDAQEKNITKTGILNYNTNVDVNSDLFNFPGSTSLIPQEKQSKISVTTTTAYTPSEQTIIPHHKDESTSPNQSLPNGSPQSIFHIHPERDWRVHPLPRYRHHSNDHKHDKFESEDISAYAHQVS